MKNESESKSEVLVAQLCLTLCDPMDCSLPGFSVHGILQARTLEWVAISFSWGSSWPRDQTQSHSLQIGSLPPEPPRKPHLRILSSVQFSSFQSLSCVWLFETPRTAACQASLSITNSQSLPKLMSIESVMPSNHLILCHPISSCLQSFSASESFSVSQFFALGGQSIGVSASASVLPMNVQDWFPLGWTGWISLQSKGF